LNYINDPSPEAEILFGDMNKIQYAFKFFKDHIKGGLNNTQMQMIPANEKRVDDIETGQPASDDDLSTIDKLKKLLEHRDNEISLAD
jgi:hypothetical protein